MNEYFFYASILLFVTGIFMMLLRQPLYKKRGKILFLIGLLMLVASLYYEWDHIKRGFDTVNNETTTPADSVNPVS